MGAAVLDKNDREQKHQRERERAMTVRGCVFGAFILFISHPVL